MIFRGDLTDYSVEKEALKPTLLQAVASRVAKDSKQATPGENLQGLNDAKSTNDATCNGRAATKMDVPRTGSPATTPGNTAPQRRSNRTSNLSASVTATAARRVDRRSTASEPIRSEPGETRWEQGLLNSASFSAEISVRSGHPKKYVLLICRKNIYWVEVSKYFV